MFFSDIPTNTECCKNCKYFVLHYVYAPKMANTPHGFSETWSGHCRHPRLKPRKIYDVCDKYEKKVTHD